MAILFAVKCRLTWQLLACPAVFLQLYKHEAQASVSSLYGTHSLALRACTDCKKEKSPPCRSNEICSEPAFKKWESRLGVSWFTLMVTRLPELKSSRGRTCRANKLRSGVAQGRDLFSAHILLIPVRDTSPILKTLWLVNSTACHLLIC